MSSEDREKVKSLAEVKEYLEQRIAELEKELALLKQIVEVVDEQLVEKSFKKPAITQEPKETVKETVPPVKIEPIQFTPEVELGRARILKSRTGETLATVLISPNEIRFIVNPSINVKVDMKPFSSFLVKKVLEAMNKMDLERVEKGKLPPGQELTYMIVQDGDRVKEIIVRNFREEYRLREIINAIRWTLETIVEKQSNPP
ncbi:MAG: hypothetical protein L4877_05595 [Aigarchaeota archaeon]|nr:hypothetical protein [Candidatus Geocrenenecus dongiae]